MLHLNQKSCLQHLGRICSPFGGQRGREGEEASVAPLRGGICGPSGGERGGGICDPFGGGGICDPFGGDIQGISIAIFKLSLQCTL